MTPSAMLTTLLPVRDKRERVIAYAVSACPAYDRAGESTEDEARATVEAVPALTRLAGRPLIVPVTPALLRDGSLTRFTSTDASWLIATDALDDAATRRALERLHGAGLHFALHGFPEGEPLPSALVGSVLIVDAMKLSAPMLDSRVRTLIAAGLRPLVRNVDDRSTRHRVLSTGAELVCGRILTRGAATPVDPTAEASCLRALRTLAAYADGRPIDGAFDTYVHDDEHLGAALMRVIGSATMGVRGPRSVGHALNVLGRDAVMERLFAVTARLLADAAHDPELALIALRRARALERLGAAIDDAPHPRSRAIAGLMSVAEFALGVPSVQLASLFALPPVLTDTLADRRLPLGNLVDIVEAMENGWWDDLRVRCTRLGIAPLVVSETWTASWRAAREELG